MSLSITLSPEFETLDAPAPPAHWGGVFAMTLCVFALIASEFMPVSLLTPLAADLGVTEGMAGQGIAISGAFAVLTSLFIPRRRVWVKATGTRLEYAGLARGEDPTLEAAVADLAARHTAMLSPRLTP